MKHFGPALCTPALRIALALAPMMSLAPLASGARAQEPAKKDAVHYVRAKAGAKLMNLADPGAETVQTAAEGTLLSVRSERAGWLEVEPPNGLRVWIYGEYLKKSGTAGVAEVTGNGVRMRPLPISNEKSFPLSPPLSKGARVHVLARQDPKKKLSEDWVQVVSPPGTTAWVVASDTLPVEAGLDTRAAWNSAVKEAGAALAVVDLGAAGVSAVTPTDASSAQPDASSAANGAASAGKSSAVALLEDAEKMMVAASATENPDYAPARAAFDKVIAAAPKGASADTARRRLDEIAAREEIQLLKQDAVAYEKKRQEELGKAEARLRDASRKQDPLWGRFQARGWLEKDVKAGATPRYVLRWGGREVAELVCASGRYDLENFVGHEIGILGVTQRAAASGAAGAADVPARIDATRIEVISGRPGKN